MVDDPKIGAGQQGLGVNAAGSVSNETSEAQSLGKKGLVAGHERRIQWLTGRNAPLWTNPKYGVWLRREPVVPTPTGAIPTVVEYVPTVRDVLSTVETHAPTAPEALPTIKNSRFWPPANKFERRQTVLASAIKNNPYVGEEYEKFKTDPEKKYLYYSSLNNGSHLFEKHKLNEIDKLLDKYNEIKNTLPQVKDALACILSLKESIEKSGLGIDVETVKELFDSQMLANAALDWRLLVEGSPKMQRRLDADPAALREVLGKLDDYPERLHAKMTAADLIWPDDVWENWVGEAPEAYRAYLNSCREAMDGSDPLILPFMIYRNNLLIKAAIAAPENSKAKAWIEGEIKKTPAGSAFDVDSSSVKLPSEDSTTRTGVEVEIQSTSPVRAFGVNGSTAQLPALEYEEEDW